MADEKVKVVYRGEANVLNGVRDPQGKEFEFTVAQMQNMGGPSSGHLFEAVRKGDAAKLEPVNTVQEPPAE